MTLDDKSVLVTGGAGFIGSHLVERLARERLVKLVVVDNLFLGKEENLEDGARAFPSLRFYKEDASDHGAMREILLAEEIDVIFDLAVIPLPTSLERPRWTVETNLAIATTLCELLREGAFRTLVHFSSSEVYGTAQYVPMDELHPLLPLTPYAASKAGADHVVSSYCSTFGIDAAIVRPFNTFGPRQNDTAYAGVIPTVADLAIRGQEVVIHGDGDQTRDFSYVQDVASAAVAVYAEPATRGEVVNVASGREISVNTLVGLILELLDADVPVLHGDPRPGDVRRHLGSSARLAELTGCRPARSFEAGLEETIRWYREVSLGARPRGNSPGDGPRFPPG